MHIAATANVGYILVHLQYNGGTRRKYKIWTFICKPMKQDVKKRCQALVFSMRVGPNANAPNTPEGPAKIGEGGVDGGQL